MIQQRDLKFGDVTYPVMFTSNALYKLEEKTGMSTERIGLLMASGRAGYQMMQIILWAGLEAARVRNKLKRGAFTIEEVGDLLDEEGGAAVVWAAEDDGIDRAQAENGDIVEVKRRESRPLHPVSRLVMEAWESTFPAPRKLEGVDPNEHAAS